LYVIVPLAFNRVGVRVVDGHAATKRSEEKPFEAFFGSKRRILDDEVVMMLFMPFRNHFLICDLGHVMIMVGAETKLYPGKATW
jgi:hypothetical protein